MDKFEYKIRAEEINALIGEGKFAEAVQIADTIDWRRVKSVMMLCKISDLYKINRRYPESRDILLLAYEKHPTSRLIVYSLCELSIKMEESVQAIEYYKEFVQIAPKDTGRYILQYRLYEAQDVSLEERIAVLEEFKKRDYREKWAYELAYLYHRIGLTTKCVEECDEMFLWFGEGKYVVKALELKKLHEPLNEDQQDKYDLWIQARETAGELYEEEEVEQNYTDTSSEDGYAPSGNRSTGYAEEQEEDNDSTEAAEMPTTELPEVKTVDVGQYNTINLQMALAESMKEILSEEEGTQEAPEEFYGQEYPAEEIIYEDGYGEAPEEEETDLTEEAMDAEEAENEPAVYEDPASVSAELYEESEEQDGYEESEEPGMVYEEPETEAMAAPVTEEEEPVQTDMLPEGVEEEDTDAVSESADDPLMKETIRLPDPRDVERRLQKVAAAKTREKRQAAEQPKPKSRKPVMDTDNLEEIKPSFDAQQILEQMKAEARKQAEAAEAERVPGARTGVLTPLNTKPSKYDSILSQEYDGQISLVMPEAERIEKQITGQLSIEDIMAEWEAMKKTNEQKRMEDVRQRILQHTGDLFANFDEATKNGLLEELERAFVAAIMKESGKTPSVKKAGQSNSTVTRKKSDLVVKSAAEEELLKEAEIDETDVPEEAEELVPEESETAEEIIQEDIEPEAEEQPENDAVRERELTEEERELFGEFIHHRKSERQLVQTLDNMSLAPYTGNVLITGEEEDTALALAKALVREMQLNDSNFSGKVAKISSAVLNKRDVEETFGKLNNGALIIEKASHLKSATAADMARTLDRDNMGLLVLMIDQKQSMNEFLEENAAVKEHFNLRVDIEALDDEALVAYARQYAEEQEYSIDEFGILALHTRIADRQTSDHEVNLAEVRELVDEAIYHANKKTPGHFMDILLAKRYDEDDMIILREKDFMHY
ncbi:MAG: hypothetical protein K2P66_05625 [Lachnospiraceae bacterium]|nr:hypothetical protein [Lachnospiraceae bacterium]